MNYKTAFVKNTWLDHPTLSLPHGWGNGYVIIPKEHPFHGIHYDILNEFVNAHGGLTFSELCDDENKNTFGLEDSDIGKWIIGFDTAHHGDSLERWHEGAVVAETDFLLAQVISFASFDRNKLIVP